MLPEGIASTDPKTQILSALQNAASATGSDFSYLLGTAMRESSLKPDAQARTSSAAGLFQFIEQTWLGVVKTHGSKHGLGNMAAAIQKGTDGRYRVADAEDRHAILALRKNPQVAALMAGEFTNDTKQMLESNLGRSVCGGELYAAHFLGADAACKLIRMKENIPSASAAAAFPQAASANKSVFYNKDGSARSVSEVYDWALRKYGDAPVNTAAVVTTNPLPAVAAPNVTHTTGTTDLSALLGDITNWAPSKGFFSGEGDVSSAPFMLTPGIFNILSSLAGSKKL